MNWLHYLVEANIYLGVFYLCYCLFLNSDTHYLLGRVYLIFSCVVAFILPVTQLSILKSARPEVQEIHQVAFAKPNLTAVAPTIVAAAPVRQITLQDVLLYAYITGAVIALFVLIYRFYKLYILTRNKKSQYGDKYKLINLDDENAAFSFFNYLFIGSNLSQAETIIAHELVHIRQKHSIDIIFMELVKVVNWFNPFVYLVQRSLKTIHEYIADEQTAAREQDALAYSSFLLHNAYGIQGSPIAHSFFNYNLLKKRIIMLNKNRSGKLARLKYLAALPLCAGMLCTSTLVFSKDYGFIDIAPQKKAIPVERIANETPKPDTIKKRLLPPLPPAKNHGKIKFPPPIVKADTDPVPPLANKHGKIKFPPPVVKPDKAPAPPPRAKRTKKIPPPVVTVVKFPPPTISQINKRPPPPVPYDPIYKDLINYVAKYTRYPAVARENNVNGHVVLSLIINNDHQLTDVKVERGIGSGCDEEVVRALKSYKGIIDKTPGEYKMLVTFMLQNNDNTKFYTPEPIEQSVVNTPNFIGQVVIAGYVK